MLNVSPFSVVDIHHTLEINFSWLNVHFLDGFFLNWNRIGFTVFGSFYWFQIFYWFKVLIYDWNVLGSRFVPKVGAPVLVPHLGTYYQCFKILVLTFVNPTLIPFDVTDNRFSSASKISINKHSMWSMYQNAANYFRDGEFSQKLQHFDFYLDLPEKRE